MAAMVRSSVVGRWSPLTAACGPSSLVAGSGPCAHSVQWSSHVVTSWPCFKSGKPRFRRRSASPCRSCSDARVDRSKGDSPARFFPQRSPVAAAPNAPSQSSAHSALCCKLLAVRFADAARFKADRPAV